MKPFSNLGQIGSFIGFTPRIDCSSTIEHYGLRKNSNAYLQVGLVQAPRSLLYSRQPSALQEKFYWMTDNGKGLKKAMIAIVRKLAGMMASILRSKKAFEARRAVVPAASV